MMRLDIAVLPFVPVEKRIELPETPCIYFAIDSNDKIQYIGKSINPRRRLQGHHRLPDFNKIGGIRIAYLDVSDPSLLEDIESALISQFCPPLNGSPVLLNGRNRRVAAYLPPDLDRKFKAFAKKSGKGESKALIAIVEAFFDRESEKSGDRIAALEAEIKRIHERIDNLEF